MTLDHSVLQAQDSNVSARSVYTQSWRPGGDHIRVTAVLRGEGGAEPQSPVPSCYFFSTSHLTRRVSGVPRPCSLHESAQLPRPS